ncbi:hypothetical protein JH306_21730 (plasmid) [Xanthomonas campestris pv. campestris]|uniref:hypothetical protein n=1 Tax=Xanthomonas campestris TaxID=339 RepID=UPI000A49C90C|nr:hypothetical protein [Xanthomonas campestris]MDM7676963.1 hypothetical protein [Xanthomonas campestris pv. campestris]MDM7880785.1 hypothetical protein [Xanthomonas campestris pv. campestris]MEA0911219.1 hypothetical protein [Xanthomonas campestris pv. campestris]MEA9838051.1 hypothetical protein [Xanthomonas campestris pv. raphani]MEB1768871.1 hypothetical protein [Xanthomonas campestris pv. campestris]
MGRAKEQLFDTPWAEEANLPEEAHAEFEGEPFEPSESWLKHADHNDQETALSVWWYSRYCDPAQNTPYLGSEGGYQYVHGGPCDPEDILWLQFGNIAHDQVLKRVISQLHDEVGDAWASRRWSNPNEYDDYYDVVVSSTNKGPRGRLISALMQGQKLQTLTGDLTTKALLNRLAFAFLFSAFETYLWETMAYWLEEDDEAAPRILDRLPEFANKELKGKEARAFVENAKENIKGYMQRLPWHRWSDVRPLLQIGLDVEIPEFREFREDLKIRHDIVHRNGTTKDGQPIQISESDLFDFGARINSYADRLEQSLAIKSLNSLTPA